MATDVLADRRRGRAGAGGRPGRVLTPGNPDDPAEALAELRGRRVNYVDAQAPPQVTAGWHRDLRSVELGREAPGEPLPDGIVETAGRLVDSYQFCDPRIIRAAFRTDGELVGRDLLLEGRFLFLRFLIGVRITERHDRLQQGPAGPERVIGWSYRTLQGHLEQGRLTYEVAKELATGRVRFRIDAYSRQAPITNPVYRLGFRCFGRATQLRFYRAALRRISGQIPLPPALPQPGPDGVVRAPAGVGPGRFDRVVLRIRHPGSP